MCIETASFFRALQDKGSELQAYHIIQENYNKHLSKSQILHQMIIQLMAQGLSNTILKQSWLQKKIMVNVLLSSIWFLYS